MLRHSGSGIAQIERGFDANDLGLPPKAPHLNPPEGFNSYVKTDSRCGDLQGEKSAIKKSIIQKIILYRGKQVQRFLINSGKQFL